MRYFKHLSDTLDDPFIFDLVEEFRSDGYFVFFRVLEIMAKDYDASKPDFSQKTAGLIRISVKFLQKSTRISVKKLKNILGFCEEFQKFKVSYFPGKVEMIEIKCNKFAELADEHTKRIKRETNDSLQSDTGVKPEPFRPSRENQNQNQNQNQKKETHGDDPSPTVLPHPVENSTPKIDPVDEAAGRVLDYLNDRTNRTGTARFTSSSPIPARIRELKSSGMTVEEAEAECRSVIDRKVDQWGDRPKMEPYLRPKTLFGANNFADYRREKNTAQSSNHSTVEPEPGPAWDTGEGFNWDFDNNAPQE